MGKKYKNPPLIEALCEIQFGPSSPWDLAIPGIIYERVKRSFPIRRQALRLSIGLPVNSGETTPQIGSMPLTQFWSEDEKSVLQVGTHLLSVNHLKPYPSWAKFLPMIEEGFSVYRDVATPNSIQTITLRYINRMEIASQFVNLEDYFEFRPFVGPNLPQNHIMITAAIQIPYEGSRDILNLQMTNLTGNSSTDTIIINLDLTYSSARLGEVSLDNVSGWADIAHLHIEEVFEACIKDQLKQKFEEVTE